MVSVTKHAYAEWTRITGHEPEMLDRVLPTGIRRRPVRVGKHVAYVLEIQHAAPGAASVFLPVASGGMAVTCLDAEEAANNYEIGEGKRLTAAPFVDITTGTKSATGRVK